MQHPIWSTLFAKAYLAQYFGLIQHFTDNLENFQIQKFKLGLKWVIVKHQATCHCVKNVSFALVHSLIFLWYQKKLEKECLAIKWIFMSLTLWELYILFYKYRTKIYLNRYQYKEKNGICVVLKSIWFK